MNESTISTHLVLVRARQANGAKLGEHLQALLPSLRLSAGCLGYWATASQETPGEWVVCGVWRSASAMQDHFASTDIQGLFQLLDNRLAHSLECRSFAA